MLLSRSWIVVICVCPATDCKLSTKNLFAYEMLAQNWANLVVHIVSHTELKNWHVHVVPITYYTLQYRISIENLTSDTKSKSKSNAFDAKRTWRTTKHGIFVHDKVISTCCLIFRNTPGLGLKLKIAFTLIYTIRAYIGSHSKKIFKISKLV